MIRIVSKLHGVYCETQPDAWKWLTPPPRSTNDQIEAAVARLADADWPDGKRWDSARDETVELVSRRDWQRLVSVGIGKKIAADDLTFYGKEIPATVVDAL